MSRYEAEVFIEGLLLGFEISNEDYENKKNKNVYIIISFPRKAWMKIEEKYFFRVVGRIEVRDKNNKDKKEWRAGEIKIHKKFLFKESTRYISFKIPFKSQYVLNIPRKSKVSLIFSWTSNDQNSRVVVEITPESLNKHLKSIRWMG